MARVNISLPDDLARRAREAGLNVSGIAQEALVRALRAHDTNAWLDSLPPATDGPLPSREMREIWDEVDAAAERRADDVVDRLERRGEG